jgi:hypothetical protein
MASASDYLRLYGGCDTPVLALSSLYAAFDGFSLGSPLSRWWGEALPETLARCDLPSVKAKATRMSEWLKRTTGGYS